MGGWVVLQLGMGAGAEVWLGALSRRGRQMGAYLSTYIASAGHPLCACCRSVCVVCELLCVAPLVCLLFVRDMACAGVLLLSECLGCDGGIGRV